MDVRLGGIHRKVGLLLLEYRLTSNGLQYVMQFPLKMDEVRLTKF